MPHKKNKKRTRATQPLRDQVVLLNPTDVLDGMKDFEKIGQGQGGFTAVYSAIKKSGGEKVALKLFLHNAFQKAIRYEKFQNEPVIMKKLAGHPHIIAGHDSITRATGKHNGKNAKVDYFTMELLGGSLTDYIEDYSDWSLSSKLDVLIQISSALEYAHEKGIYHRDLYSDNVLLVDFTEPLHAKLMDFGSAKINDAKSKIVYDHPMGAFNFSSPEILARLATSTDAYIKSDVFSLGLLIYSIISKSPHPLVPRLSRMSPIDGINTSTTEKLEYLNNLILPYLQPVANQSILILDAIPNSKKMEQALNQLLSNATSLTLSGRTESVKLVRQELESCRSLLNA